MTEYRPPPLPWQPVVSCVALMSTRAPALILLAAWTASCGGGSSGPTNPGGSPTPSAPPGSAVSGFVFYDENGNGTADPTEVVRLPGVGVAMGGVTTSTVEGGRFSFPSVPNGTQTAQASPASLPAVFSPGSPLSVGVPSTADVPVPALLPIGSRARPNVYLAFGDSITYGDGSSDEAGYRDWLRASLQSYWGKADIVNDGVPGTQSKKGASRVGASLAKYRPAYLLILYGTNDWNDAACRTEFPCYTIDSLRTMVLSARDAGAFPIVGTIPPVNPSYADRDAEARNDWVRRMNDLVRAMARQERAPIAEVHGDFLKQSSLPPLFFDFLHPNDDGYQLIAQAFFNAITRPLSATSSGSAPAFFFEAPGGN
jgi:lysophospholipase L1-like esterase